MFCFSFLFSKIKVPFETFNFISAELLENCFSYLGQRGDGTWAHLGVMWSPQCWLALGLGSLRWLWLLIPSFLSYSFEHIRNILDIQINIALRSWATHSSFNGSKCYEGNDSLPLLELGLPGQGRVHVYFGKRQTFTHLNSSKISVRGWPQEFHIS